MESETLFSNRSSAALLRRLEEEHRLLVKEVNAPARAESEPLSSRQPSYSSGAPSQRSARHTPYEAQPPPPPHAGDHGLYGNEDEDVMEEEQEERYAVTTTSEGEDGAQYRRRLDPSSREHRGSLDAREEEATGGGGGGPSEIAKVTIVQGDRDALVIRPQDALEATSGGSARPAPPLLLFERGLFQIQIQSFVDIPVVAKLEVDGGMTRSNFRVLPRGVHTIRETRAAIGQHGVPLAFQPTESHLLPMPAEVIDDSDMLAEVINERTGILRVLLFAVYDTETRNYKWKWDPSAPLQIEEFRYGLAETFVGQQFPEVGQWLRSGSTAYRQPRARGGQRSNTQTPLEQNPLLLHTALNPPPPPPFQKDSGAGRAGRSHSNEDRRRSSRNGSPHDDAHPAAAATTTATNPRGRQHQHQPSSQQQRDVPHRRNHTEAFDDIPMVQSTLSHHYYNNDTKRNNEKRHHHAPSGAAQYQDRDKEGAGIRSQSSSESRPRADNSGSGGLSKFLQLYPICETCNPVVERIVASVVRQKQIEVDELNLAYRQQREELREAQYRIKQLQKQVTEMQQNGTGETTTTTRRASRSPPMTKSSRLREERSLAKQQPIPTEDGASFGSKQGKPSARESLVSVKPRVIHGHQPVAPPQALARGVRETVVVPHHRAGEVLALGPPPPTVLPAPRANLPNQDPSVVLPSTAVATAIPAAAGELGRVEPRSSRTYQDALDEEWDRIVFGRAAERR